MNDLKINENLKKNCVAALAAVEKINTGGFEDIKAKLEYVINSYEYDKNPIGLHEIGAKALDILKAHKLEKPRSVTKKVIDGLEKAVEKFVKAYN